MPNSLFPYFEALGKKPQDGALAIQGDRIVAVGASEDLSAQYSARRVIDAHRHVVMPGLIDSHGHAGHSLSLARNSKPLNLEG